MKRCVFPILVLFIVVLSGCGKKEREPQAPKPPKPAEKKSAASTKELRELSDLISRFNRAAGLLEQFRYKEAAAIYEAILEKKPDWTAARFNLALAYLNLQSSQGAKEYLEKARKIFEEMVEAQPDHTYAHYCLGLYHQHLGNLEKTFEHYKKVYEHDPDDPYVVFKFAEAQVNMGNREKSVELLEKVIELDPGFVSAMYKLGLQYRRLGKVKESVALLERFKELRSLELTGGIYAVNKPYGSAGKYYFALGIDRLPLPPPETDSVRILFAPQKVELAEAVKPWQWKGGKVAMPGVAAADVDGDGDLDLCLAGAGENGEVSIWHNLGDGAFTKGAVVADSGVSPSFGDVDNDGDPDLYLGAAGAALFFENDGKGIFKKGAGPAAGGEQDVLTTCARLVDIDSDGDLDFLNYGLTGGSFPIDSVSEAAAGHLYNNNRDGTFTDLAPGYEIAMAGEPVTSVLYDDFDNDRDLDIVLFHTGKGGSVAWINDRVGKYRKHEGGETGLAADGVISATSGDPDKDGDRDILVFCGDTITLFENTGRFRFKESASFASQCAKVGGTGGQFVDMDNDGDLDIVVMDAKRRGTAALGPAILINHYPEKRFVKASDGDPGILLSEITTSGGTSCVAGDFTGNGFCDLFIAPSGGKPFLLKNETRGGSWIALDLAGTRTQDSKTRSNNSAIGARVEIKTGRVFQRFTVGVPSGASSMPPFRVHAGLGENRKVDWLRIIWPDGVLQAELELPANRVTRVEELQRKTSSCPVLFAWDGEQFAFVSDFAGVGGLGYLVEPGVYAPPDPTEYVPIPHLESRGGEYVLQAIENLEEIVYFDQASLIAVDHPEGTTVYPNEMMAINAPPPEFEVFCWERAIDVEKATDHRGVDVTEKLEKIDRRYAGATDLTVPFMGFAGDHEVVLDFGSRLQTLSEDQRLVLCLYGWVEYGYSATNFAASQAGAVMRAPSIYALRDGKWVMLFDQVGYPAGINHMMTLEVTGKVKPGDRKLKITSNMELYWDRIFLAPLSGGNVFSLKEVPCKSADLHFLGYPKEYSPDGHHPNIYDYNNIDTAVAWKLLAGEYTRYGEVAELLKARDDIFAIMGRGEEITLRFAADAFAPLKEGMKRSFILKTDAFCKDMDLYTAYPDTVEPLPFHGMSAYPYKEDEAYPDTEKIRAYRRKYNTRKICTR